MARLLKWIGFRYFVNGERFYNLFLPILLVVIGALAMLLLMMLFYTVSKKIRLTLLAIILILGAGTLLGVQHYADYLAMAEDLTPNIRTQEPTLTGPKETSRDNISIFRKFQSRQLIEKLDLYHWEKVQEPVTYLGQLDGGYYFEYRGRVYYLRDKFKFVSSEQAYLTGIQYHLDQPEFAELGFVTETNYYLDHLLIPIKQEAQEYQPDNTNKARIFSNWQDYWATIDYPENGDAHK